MVAELLMAMVTELNEQERDKESTTFFFDWVAFQVFCEQRDCFWNLAGPGPCVLRLASFSSLGVAESSEQIEGQYKNARKPLRIIYYL